MKNEVLALKPGEKAVFVEEVNINKLGIKYCQIVGARKGIFSLKIIVGVDYGQAIKLFQPQLIRGSDGKSVIFNSMIDALNFMERNGWEYVNNYAIADGTGGSVYHYLLRKAN